VTGAPSGSLSRRASVLVAALLTLVILQLVVATMVIAGGRESDQTRSRWGQARAYYNAESAAAMSLRELKRNTDFDGDSRVGGISDDGTDANNPVLNGGRLKAVYTEGASNTISTSGSAITATRGPVLSVTRSTGAAYRPGLYLESWVIPSHVLVNAFNWSQVPTTVGWVDNVYWPNQPTNAMMFVGQTNSAVRLTGKINVTTAGIHAFGVDVDDDVRLYIDGVTVLHANGNGGCRRISGSINLTAGLHDFELRFTDGGGSGCLMAWWRPPGAAALTVIPPTAFQWAPAARLPGLLATSTISFSGTGTPAQACGTTGWDGTLGPYSAALALANEGDIASNATAANTVTGYNNATIRGDVFVGVGGNPATAVVFNSGATVTGSRAASARRVANVFDRLPAGLPASSGALSLNGSASATISADRRYDSITLSNNSTLTVNGDRTVYVTGSVNLSNSSRINVGANSVLRLYIDGGMNVNNSAVVNTSTNPARCLITFRGNAQTVSITNTAELHAHVRAPLCSVGMSSNSLFSGTLYANTFQASNQAQVYLDCGPLGSGGTGGGGGGGGGGSDLSITAYTDP